LGLTNTRPNFRSRVLSRLPRDLQRVSWTGCDGLYG